ncbi:MAG: cohesin domain-containing protein [Lentimicrobium sp.]
MKQTFLLIVFWFLSWMVAFTQEITVEIPTLSAPAIGQTIDVPVILTGASVDGIPISACDVNIAFDNSALTYVDLVNFSPIAIQSEWVFNSTNGIVYANWVEPSYTTAIAFPDGTTLFYIRFTYNGGSSSLVFTKNQFFDVNYLLVPTIPINGAVNGAPTTKTLNLKAYIQGFWNGTGMNQAQDVDVDENIFNKFPGLTVDTLSVYLADNTDPFGFVFSAHEVGINTDGTMTVTVPAAFSGSYYIALDHHSSVETWSMNPVDFSGTTINYDFTVSADQAYGSNQKDLNLDEDAPWGLFSGDVNNDEYTEFVDVIPIYNLNVNGYFGYVLEDLDGNGYIEFLDYIIAYNNNVNGVGINTPANPAKRPGLFNIKLID